MSEMPEMRVEYANDVAVIVQDIGSAVNEGDVYGFWPLNECPRRYKFVQGTWVRIDMSDEEIAYD